MRYLILILLFLSPSVDAQIIRARNMIPIETGSFKVGELSGLLWVGEDRLETGVQHYWAITDTSPTIFRLKVKMDGRGSIEKAEVYGRISLGAGVDTEDLAYLPKNDRLYVVDETGPNVLRFNLDGKKQMNRLNLEKSALVPPIFKTKRSNLGFEAIAVDPTNGSVWTANEEALTADGGIATNTSGSLVRLLRMDREMVSMEQWAYLTDPIDGREPFFDPRERSGIVAMAVLEDGKLLVLERSLDVRKAVGVDIPVFRSRLFSIDPEARDPLEKPDLPLKIGNDLKILRKRLVWEESFDVSKPNNFEGMALGPILEDGSQSLMLVSDNQQGKLQQNLMALTVRY